MMVLREDFQEWFKDTDAFDGIFNLEGRIFREHKNRKTFRIVKDGKGYFVKTHRSVGWNEILKNIIRLKMPVLGAWNEVHAIKRLEELGVATMRMVGYGVRGTPPAWLDSFVITEELENTISLEDFTRNWCVTPPDTLLKRMLILKVADIARRLHRNGVNHRDFYICHFFLDLTSLNEKSGYEGLTVYLIDLHRVQLREKTPQRWIIKDLAGLFFSSMDIGLTQRDVFRFLREYTGKPLRSILKEDRNFWRHVNRRAVKLYRKHFGRDPGIAME
ncbi:MAG: lipopolysaccharide core heptose(I) kinase RfaP [Nitrospirota bacterium]